MLASYVLPYRYTWDDKSVPLPYCSVIQNVNKLVFKIKKLFKKQQGLITATKVKKQRAVTSYFEMI